MPDESWILTPINGDETTVSDLILWVHSKACPAEGELHDAYCNTLRLLAEDHEILASADRDRRHLRRR